jgi:anti-sigma B factor antagonist
MDMSVDTVEVAIRDQEAFVRVCGRATFKIGPSLKQFGVMAVERGCRRFIVEMQNCVGMDSTFMGILAGLATTLKKTEGDVVLRNLSEKNLFLVKMLGLSHLVTIDNAEPSVMAMPVKGHVLQHSDGDKKQMTETMIDAHETLIEAAPGNIIKFKDVLAYLKEDLNRTIAQESGAPVPPR